MDKYRIVFGNWRPVNARLDIKCVQKPDRSSHL